MNELLSHLTLTVAVFLAYYAALLFIVLESAAILLGLCLLGADLLERFFSRHAGGLRL